MKRRLFVVIHALDTESYGPEALPHILESAKIAFEEGANGVFLIPDYEKGEAMAKSFNLAKYYHFLYEEYKKKNFRIGVNFLLAKKYANSYERVLESLVSKVDPQMLQMDYLSSNVSKHYYPDTEIFGSFAFKYSKDVGLMGNGLKEVARLAENYCDVPTTSGKGTGVAADTGKIKEIRSYLKPNTRLGLASGVSIENAESFLEAGATDFLVATSLIKEVVNKKDILNPLAVKSLAKIIRDYE